MERERVYQGSKNSTSPAIINNEGKAAIKFLKDLISWVRTSVPKCSIRLNQKHGFI